MSDSTRIGFIGLGLMGQAFIHNLRKSQYIVQGFDVDPARMDQLAEQGGHPVATPAEAPVRHAVSSVPSMSASGEAVAAS